MQKYEVKGTILGFENTINMEINEIDDLFSTMHDAFTKQSDVSTIERETFEVTEEIKNFSKILSAELNLKIFGFDMVCPLDTDKFSIIDLNDFPSFRGIPNVEKDLKEYIENYALNL